MLVAIVSQNSFVLVCMGYRTDVHALGALSHHFGGVLTSLTKYRSDSIAISRDIREHKEYPHEESKGTRV